MQTRAAAKRLADAAAAATSVLDLSLGQMEVEQAPTVTAGQELIDHRGATSKMIIGRRKRKRVKTQPAQPLKGGWALPHGMGAGIIGSETLNTKSSAAELSVSSLTDIALDIEAPIQDITVPAKSRTDKKAAILTRQARFSLRVTKARLEGQTRRQNEQGSMLKLEESKNHAIKQEDGRPNKRVRIVLVPAKSAPDVTVPAEAELGLNLAKSGEKKASGRTTPKVLIIKGITIKGSLVIKTSSKIITDATQLLDPNFRRTVKRGKENPYGLTPGFSPYPYRRVPTPEACEEVHRILTELHGEVRQPKKQPAASLEVAGCGEVPCVLDALLRTLISGNTLMALADAAIKNLAQHYGLRKEGTGAGSINWDKVRLSSHQELANVIKLAGNGPKRSHHIKQILDMVYDENLQRVKGQYSATAAGARPAAVEAKDAMREPLSLDHMHTLTKDEALAKFVSYPGIGIKTAACVTLFCLRMPCFAVDTHVHKFCRWLGWVPEKADPDNCFRHGDFMVPDHLKYGLHQLFIRHGQLCFKCRKVTKPGTKDWNQAPDCPLEHLLDRSKDEAGSKAKQPRKMKEESRFEGEVSESGGSESEGDVDEGGKE